MSARAKPTRSNWNCWQKAEIALSHCQRVLLHGPPGTGKTHAACHLGVQNNQEVYPCILTPETPAAELRGGFLPVGGSNWDWRHGPAIWAWLNGARLVLNEIDRASGDTLTFLLAVLDDLTVARLMLPSNEMVKPSPSFTVVGTMNGDPETLGIALRDRFTAKVHIDEPHPQAVAMLPPELRDVARRTILESQDGRAISFRAWRDFAYLRGRVDPEVAAELCFGARAADILNALKIAR
jgi:MoxR-like ATPase